MFEEQRALRGPPLPSSGTLHCVQVTSQCRVDASPDWVRTFLLAGTKEDDVTVDGDVIEVHQRDRLIDLVVRNRLSPDGEGGTVLDVDADLRLLGVARIVGGLFHRRVRRTLELGLDRLPVAMEHVLELEQSEETSEDEATARRAEAEDGAGG